MKKITVLSGKGGVGKSSITASLAVLLAKKKKIVVADCDVDAPNLALVLGLKDKDFTKWEKVQTSEKAVVIKSKEIDCERIEDVCYFNAISCKNKKVIIDKLLCEGCGACELIDPKGAIKLVKVNNGKIGFGETRYGFKIASGQLKIGESGTGKIVTLVRMKAQQIAKQENAETILVDAAAGIGCPVIASVVGSDYVIAVTEPTPSAFSDLGRALSVVRNFGIKAGIVINRHDINKPFTKKIENFAKKEGIQVLGKIPYDKRFVDALVHLRPVVVYDGSFDKIFLEILNKIMV
ncbi:ATP-binding protein [Candidatus Woesearchaeota archaeon]|nr:ATP-binding protein [Candidatus Woesearchaeota archaeon]